MLTGEIQGHSSGDEFDPRIILAIIRRRFWAILAVMVVVLVVAALHTGRQTELYTAQSSIALEVRQNQVIDIESVISGVSGDAAAIATEIEVLRSRALAKAVVDDLGLINYPELNPTLETLRVPAGPIASLRRFFRSLLPQQVSPQAAVEPQIDPAAVSEAVVSRVLGGLSVSRLGNTYIIYIHYTSQSPRLAQDVANAYADAYLNYRLEGRFEATERANEWLSERVEALRSEVRVRERAVIDFRESANLISTGGSTLAEQQVADINSQLAVQRAALSEASARLDTVRSQLDQGVSPDAIGLIINSEVVQSLRTQEAQIRARLIELSSRYGQRHPLIVTANRELADVEAQLDRSIARIISNLEGDVAGANQRVRSLNASLASARAELAQNNAAIVRLRELEREAEASRALFESFLNRFRETNETETLMESDARIVAPAILPQRPSSPNHQRNMMIGFVLAVIAAAGVAALLEILDSGLRTETDVEQKLGLAHVASIPSLKPGLLGRLSGRSINPVDHVVAKPLSSFAESFRTIRSAIRLSAIDQDSKIIAISSAVPGEGKTTLTVGLGRVSAMAGTKTIVIDCDLRRRLLTKSIISTKVDAGLLEVLSQSTDLQSAIIRDADTELDILPIADTTFTPRDVFGTRAFSDLLDNLRSSYDQVIIDTAPILAVADTRAIAAQADSLLIAARWRRSSVSLVRRAISEFRSTNATILGVVLNSVDFQAQSRYGYGDAANYYRSYRKYYSE